LAAWCTYGDYYTRSPSRPGKAAITAAKALANPAGPEFLPLDLARDARFLSPPA